MRAEGYYLDGEGFKGVGSEARILLVGDQPASDSKMVFGLPYYLVFNNYSSLDPLQSLDLFVNIYAMQDKYKKSFAPLRFFLKFEGQDDTGGLTLSSFSVPTKSSSQSPPEERDLYFRLVE